MKNVNGLILKMFVRLRSLKRDTKGQDLIEYALVLGFITVAAGAILPGVSTSISQVMSKVASLMSAAAI